MSLYFALKTVENNKNKKSVKFQGDMLNHCNFIQVFVFTTNRHLKLKKNTPKSNNFYPVPAASTAVSFPTIISLLLWFLKNVQTLDGNTYQTDS